MYMHSKYAHICISIWTTHIHIHIYIYIFVFIYIFQWVDSTHTHISVSLSLSIYIYPNNPIATYNPVASLFICWPILSRLDFIVSLQRHFWPHALWAGHTTETHGPRKPREGLPSPSKDLHYPSNLVCKISTSKVAYYIYIHIYILYIYV